MSGSTQPSTDRFPVPGTAGTMAESAVSRLGETVRVLAFWGAILLPLAYVPVLHESVAGQRVDLFLLLLVLHVACILVGHERARNRSPGAGESR
ncbi:hypothetical protein AArcSl_0085 [Halalkaliarchaeum desulfuricum]|uniref:Uncharacterized protein n=1 Tax=Halalkaliarchaeum desulfuricum TaxID=2055893 RepID=A0A343TF71_9EURY|nr:hypothetical protein [Halalkaliarchaeum desulfuricum]AUX07743.1 hypothetical protein AArcSl_0085 [Halalkaliarchaeum desulfuricum]